MEKFKSGDKVWIQRTEYVENVDLIKSVQTVDYAIDVPINDENMLGATGQAIYLVGSSFIYSNEDLVKEKNYELQK
jgi:hypothetical protein